MLFMIYKHIIFIKLKNSGVIKPTFDNNSIINIIRQYTTIIKSIIIYNIREHIFTFCNFLFLSQGVVYFKFVKKRYFIRIMTFNNIAFLLLR